MQIPVGGSSERGLVSRLRRTPPAPILARPVRLSFSLFSLSFSFSSLPRWPKWIPPFNDLASPSTTTSLCRSPPDRAPEVARGRVRGSHKGFGATRWDGSLPPYPSPRARAALGSPPLPLWVWRGVALCFFRGHGGVVDARGLEAGRKGTRFLVGAGPGEGARPSRALSSPAPPPAGPFPPDPGAGCPAPSPNHLNREPLSPEHPLLGPRRKFGSREGRSGHLVTGFLDPLTQAPGETGAEG